MTSEQEAVAEKENVRHALAKSALALAEAAYREADGPAMQSALDTVPADLRDANWSYLLDQSDTSIARVSANTFLIRSVAAHPKQPGVFAVSGDKQQVTLLNGRTGERVLRFDFDLGKIPPNVAFHLAFSPNGERIAIGKGSSNVAFGAIAIHSTIDGTKLLAWEAGHVSKIEFSPDGSRLLQTTRSLDLNLWDATNGKLIWNYKPAKAKALHGAFTPDGQHVLAITGAGGPVLLNVANGSENRTLAAKIYSIGAFAIRPDGRAVLWGDTNGYVHCADLNEGRLIFSNRAHDSLVRHAAFSPDGERFISVAVLPDGRHSILVSNARTGAPLQSLLGGMGGVRGIAVHPLSGELLVGGNVSRVWDITGTIPRWTMHSSGEGVRLGGAAFFGSDEMFLGPAPGFRTVLQDLRDTTVQWKASSGAHHLPSVSADGRFVAVANQGISSTRIQVARRDEGSITTLCEFDLSGNLVALRLNPAGDRLAIATRRLGKRLTIFDGATGKELVAFDQKNLQEITDFSWLNSGTQIIGLATANKPRGVEKSEERIILWDAATGQQVRSVVHPTALDCLVVAPDRKSFAAAGADKLVHVFDTETLAERQTFRAHDGPITALAWHPTRPILSTGSADLTIKLWNLDTGRRLETLRGPTAAPRVLNFSPSGQRLACASEDRMVRIWEPKPLNNAVLDAPSTDGWEDLLAKLTADEVKANGNGWTLSGGVLLSPNAHAKTLPLPGNFARSNYAIRLTGRRLSKDGLAVVLPVGDQQVAFYLDYRPSGGGCLTGITMLPGEERMIDRPDTANAQQVTDSEQHDLEIAVQLGARTAQIKATLDDRPIYEWSGSAAGLRVPAHWPPLPQPSLALGANGGDWVVSAVQVKRLEAKP